ncbi:efflux RND transporter periplasmic adaptor subunit [Pseudorhodoplanes sp.]|jgi:multidrug efflux system membrane fusion protein|uniref:efflux RND transporter periplasmic adaptor subunit n=1 Tax=Pseudorhodoplanes sp. TaxID=1934341 RepID=UPI002BF1AAE5|nr:efflux RND transporter periplasmic adaptor subunit [Pseudorhodoplanes sp.]HWV41450.1 efflux RND transporter periplasmic adaptor subunit [Pseudorhodoplanes sp.]
MNARKWSVTLAALVAVGVAAYAIQPGLFTSLTGSVARLWSPEPAAAQKKGPPPRQIPVEAVTAELRDMPVRLEALGTVTPIASVAIKARLESVITGVHFRDGAMVNAGDLLFTLDSRQLEAEIKRVEAVIAGAVAQQQQAERDVERYNELVKKNAVTQVTLNNAQTQVNIASALAASNRATLDNLKVQLSWTSIRAPISGRISAANVKVGNFVRPADTAPLATINQIKPVYVTFGLPQGQLPDLRKALAAETASVDARAPGETRVAHGQVTMIENSVDPGTGMVLVRATMDNKDELLWPGTLVNTQVTLREEKAVIIPSPAVQVGQGGSFVFVVEDGVAKVRPVTVDRTVDMQSVITKGLTGGETVVVDGQLQLVDGTRVVVRGKGKPGA